MQDFERLSWHRANKVLMPRPAGIFQGFVDMFLDPLFLVINLRVGNPIRQFAHVLLQPSVHYLEAADQKRCMLIGGADTESWSGAPSWIDNEVWE